LAATYCASAVASLLRALAEGREQVHAHRPQVARPGDVDARVGELAVADLRIVPAAVGDDRVAADDAVGDLHAGLAAEEELRPEGLIDERAQLGRRVAADVELLHQRDVGVEAVDEPSPGGLVRLEVAAGQVRRHHPQRHRQRQLGRVDRDGVDVQRVGRRRVEVAGVEAGGVAVGRVEVGRVEVGGVEVRGVEVGGVEVGRVRGVEVAGIGRGRVERAAIARVDRRPAVVAAPRGDRERDRDPWHEARSDSSARVHPTPRIPARAAPRSQRPTSSGLRSGSDARTTSPSKSATAATIQNG
jgi:hypothetical protein